MLSSAAGDAPPGFAGSLLNVRLGDGAIRPRYGYRNLAGAPTGLAAVHGLVRLSGYGEDYAHRVEWVTIENRGAVRPYAVDPATWARTEITNGGTPLSLGGGDWLGFSYNGTSYFVNPGGSPSVYRHAVGDPASWEPLQDAAYAPSPEDPTFAADLLPPAAYPFGLAGDVATVSGPGVASPTTAVNADGSLTVSGRAGNDAQETASSIVTLTFGAAQDFSTTDYHGFLAVGEDVYVRFKTGVRLEVKIAGTWSEPERRAFLSEDRTRTGVVMRLKDVAGANAVQAVRLTLRAEPQPRHAGKAYTLLPYQLGGSYLGAAGGGDRPWDANYKTADVAYAARYVDVAAGTSTGIKSVTKDRSVFGRYGLDASFPLAVLGDRITLSVEPLTTGGYAVDPTGASYRIEYLRLDGNGTWRSLGTTPNAADALFRDRFEERQVLLLTAATGVVDYVPPAKPPVFKSDGFVAGVPYKGWVVWLKRGGKANVIHSRVGDAESLYSPGDTDDDAARGADFTLADDFADEPLGAVQAGDAILIAGREGVYGQSGNSPATMTPTRKLPGAMGCAGRFAFARYRDEAGNYGIAWLDVPGEAVWFASAALLYASDAQARPTEISLPIRGSVRSFLFEEQRVSLPMSLALAVSDGTEPTHEPGGETGEPGGGTGGGAGGSTGGNTGGNTGGGGGTGGGAGGGSGGGAGGDTGGGSGGTGGGTSGSGGGTGDAGGSPALALENARLDVDEATGSLWVVLGSRALVLRPPSPLDGARHWERHEYALGSATGDVVVCAEPLGATAGASVARPGSTDAWSNPANVGLGGEAASVALAGGRVSQWLCATGLMPTTLFPSEGSLTTLKARIRHRLGSVTPTQVGATLDTVALYVGGVLRSSVPVGTLVPTGTVDLDVSLPLNGTTLAEVNAGTCEIRAGYTAGPAGTVVSPVVVRGDHATFVPPYWVDTGIDVTSGSAISLTASGGIVWGGRGGTTATPNGDSSWPFFPISGTPLAQNRTPFSLVLALGGPTDPGFGVPRTSSGYGTYQGGTGPINVSSYGDGRLYAGFNDICGDANGVAEPPPTHFQDNTGQYDLSITTVRVPSSVWVESIGLRACYTVPQATGTRGVSYLAFGPDRNLVWLRSSGHLDSAEWCPSCVHFVEGSNRDGGLPMPPGHWETGRLAGGQRRLARAEVEREGYGALDLAATTDRTAWAVPSTAPEGRRWARWGVVLQGRTHRVRLLVDESTVGVRAMDLVFQPVSGPDR